MSTPIFTSGTLPVWRHPIRKMRSTAAVDKLSGTYICATSTTLAPGDAVPGFTGMIIRSLTETSTGRSRQYEIDAEGSIDNSRPTKCLSSGFRRTLNEGWDQRSSRYITWHGRPKAITAAASNDTITCTAHGFSNAQRVIFPSLTGGSGINAPALTGLSTVYYVIDAATNTFKVSLTAGGAAVDITTDVTAGYVLAAEYSLGIAHDDWPYMYLTDISATNDGCDDDWDTLDLTFTGLESVKPWKRRITTNGQTFSAETNSLFIDGFYEGYPPELVNIAQVHSPAIFDGAAAVQRVEYDVPNTVITDILISLTAPPHDYVGRFWTPDDAPDVWIPTIVADTYVYHIPYGWKCISVDSEQIPGRDLWLITLSWTYGQQTTAIA